MAEDQLRIGDHAQPNGEPAFLTDDSIDRRLSQVEAGLQHMEAILPAMRREVAFIRGHLRQAA